MSLRIFTRLLSAIVLACASVAGAAAARVPVAGADLVVARDPQGSEVARLHTDAQGAFVIKDLAPGHYTIFVSSLGIARAAARSGTWVVALLAIGSASEPLSSRPVTYGTKEVSGGLQAAITVPAGPARSYKGTLSH